MKQDYLRITDQRTGLQYDLPVKEGAVRAMDFRQIKTGPDDFGLMVYDPAFMNTASCRSAITFIDGEKGILLYCGYPVEELAEQCSFLEVAYLLICGKLPDAAQLSDWTRQITHHTMVHENLKKFMEGFRHDAHPMGMFVSSVAALSTFYPDARNIKDPDTRMLQILRLIGKVPTIAAFAYRHSLGLPYVYPDNRLSYTANFMSMLWKMAETSYEANPVLARALDVLFVLHADHEQNCSTNTMRSVGSSHADPYLSVAAAAAALSGPLHGGANEEVLKMLDEIGRVENVGPFVDKVKKGERRLMGFGHRVYKNYDPRARIIRRTAEEVFEVTGPNRKLEIAKALEETALKDEYFIQRKLYPNVDFYSGIIYEAMGFRPEMFTVLFAIPRTVGWLAQWQEMLEDPEQKIARPRQIYIGEGPRPVKPPVVRTNIPVAVA